MPEFVMENRNECFREESQFVAGFIEALFFTESSNFDSSVWWNAETQKAIEEGQIDGNIPNDCGYCDLEPESLASIRKFCEAFQTANAELLALAYERPDYSEAQAGRDLLYTHCGHGVGYWDRETLATDDSEEYERLTDIMRNAGDNREAWQEALNKRNALKAEAIGERLSKAAGRGECTPYYGENGLVSVSMY